MQQIDEFVIIGDPHIVHRSLDTASKLFEVVEALGKPSLWTGDILDNKEIIRGKCLNLFFEYLRTSKLQHLILVGNHDYFNLECKDHSLRALSALPNVKIVDEPCEWQGITCIPYVHDLEKLKTLISSLSNQNRVLFGHLDVVEFDYGNGQTSDKGLLLQDLSGFKRVISGHYHKFQQKENLTYIGSPFTHSWGETDQMKVIGQYKVSTDELTFLTIPLPKHVTLSIDLDNPPSDKDLDVYFTENAGNYIRGILKGPQSKISAFSRDSRPSVKKWIPKATDVFSNDIVLEESLDNKHQFIKWATDIKKLDKDTIDIGLGILNGLQNVVGLPPGVKGSSSSLIEVKAKNMFSWGDLDFKVPKGVTLIDGWNADDETPEGSGKSAIPNITCWILFGEFPKEANIDDVIKFGEKSGGGAAYFDDGMAIVRTRKPNDLYLRKDGQIIKGKDAKETQQLIIDYLGMTFRSYCQSSYFAQNYDKKFLPSNQEDKGRILSDIQDISVFDKAKKEAQDLAKIENEKLVSLKNQIKVEENTLSGYKTQQTMVRQFIEDKERQHQEYLKVLTNTRDSAKTGLENVQAKQNEVRLKVQDFNLAAITQQDHELRSAYEQVQTQIAGVVYNKSQITGLRRNASLKQDEGTKYANKYKSLEIKKASLEAFIANPSRSCPTCNTRLAAGDTSHAQKELQEVIDDLDVCLSNLTEISNYLDSNPIQSDQELVSQEAAFRRDLNVVDQELKKLQNLVSENRNFNNMILNYDQEIVRIQKSLQEAEKAIENSKFPDLTAEHSKLTNLEELHTALTDKIVQIMSIKDQTEAYASRLEALKDGFKEIKSYVFSTALSELSRRSNEFLSGLFHVAAKIEFKNEDLKIETKIYLNEQEMGLGLLSGGQFRRFSLAVDLALSDMVSSRRGSKVGLLICDEYFKDLSEESMEKCLELLKSRKIPVILIEHNSIFKNIVHNTFRIRLENGTSRYDS